jgi:UDP-4-amino-4,6-dideoxy-N-acetyl-beta-L-altrosamine N-acetyltransferase
VTLPQGEKVRLREIRDEDLERIVRWRNDPEILSRLFSHEKLTIEKQREWFAGLAGDKSRVSFIVETLEGRAVGQGGFSHIDRHSRVAEMGIMIGEREEQGRGLGTAAVRLLIDYGFRELDLHRISLRVLEGNERALNIYRRLGFRDEGVQREAVRKDGAFRDVVLLGLLEYERDRG